MKSMGFLQKRSKRAQAFIGFKRRAGPSPQRI
jgi:hypothetical protein